MIERKTCGKSNGKFTAVLTVNVKHTVNLPRYRKRQIHKYDEFTDRLTDGHQGSYTSKNNCCSRGDGIEESWTQYGGGGLGGGEGCGVVCGERKQAGWGGYMN